MVEIFKNFLEFILKAKDFEIYTVETQEEMSDTVNFLVSTLKVEEQTEDKIDEMVDWAFGFEKIIWCKLWLNHRDYNKIISEWKGREFIRNEQFITNVATSDGSQMMILHFSRVKAKNSRKTVEELQNDLDEAVGVEDYEMASILKTKISQLLEKEKKGRMKMMETLKGKIKAKSK